MKVPEETVAKDTDESQVAPALAMSALSVVATPFASEEATE